MPSHIFTRVGAWQESVRANQASAKSGTDKTFDKWHAYDYMVYAYLQLGEDSAACKVVTEALGNQARVDHFATAYAYAAMPARLAVERGNWQEAARLDLAPNDGFPWAKYPQAKAINAFARGLGSAMTGDAAVALREFESVLEQEPNRLAAFAGAADAAQRAGDSEKAQGYLAKVMELTKTADTPVSEVAQVKRLLGRQ